MKLFYGALPLVAIALVAGLSGCGTELGPTTSGTFSDVYTNTLKPGCTECHVPTGAATVDNEVELDFSTQAKAYQTLTEGMVAGITSRGYCPNVALVAPSNTETSYLAAVLFSDYSTDNFAGVVGCTPYSAHHLNVTLLDAQKESILAWISAGAKND